MPLNQNLHRGNVRNTYNKDNFYMLALTTFLHVGAMWYASMKRMLWHAVLWRLLLVSTGGVGGGRRIHLVRVEQGYIRVGLDGGYRNPGEIKECVFLGGGEMELL